MVKINSGFITRFKVGDNIVYNLKTLAILYRLYEDKDDDTKSYLRKIMVILIGSICEAVLFDFLVRIKRHTKEGVSSLKETVIDYIRNLKNISKFHQYIDQAQKHKFFEREDFNVYEALYELKDYRNRVHIQNFPPRFEPNDSDTFSIDALTKAERTLEAVMREMEKHHLREEKYWHCDSFVLPWNSHFSSYDNGEL